MKAKKTEFSFSLVLSGLKVLDPEGTERLYEACGDCILGIRSQVVRAGFDCLAESLGSALGKAVEGIEKAGFEVASIEGDNPATCAALAKASVPCYRLDHRLIPIEVPD